MLTNVVSTRAAAFVSLKDVDELLQFEVAQPELILTFLANLQDLPMSMSMSISLCMYECLNREHSSNLDGKSKM